MKRQTYAVTGCVLLACAALVADIGAQGRRGGGGGGAAVQGRGAAPPATARVADDPFSGPVVKNAPFSADAVTTVTQVLGDGTRIEQSTTARFYRDSAGRIRREQPILGLSPALNPSGESRMTITIDPDPEDQMAYTLDPANRTARRVPRGYEGALLGLLVGTERLYYATNNTDSAYFNAGDRQVRLRVDGGPLQAARLPADGVRQPEESLGTRQVEGVSATGRRTKSVIPLNQIGNDRPIEITDERWESTELGLLIRSHHHDPRTGDVEYRLTNIVRRDPPADLFTVPADYTIVEPGGRGGRGPASGAGTGGGLGPRSGGGARGQ